MTYINSTLMNFSQKSLLLSIFGEYSNDFEYTTDGIFRRRIPPKCPKCNTRTNHNGYNEYRKKHLGCVKIGRYLCPCCKEPLEENRSFWEKLKKDLFGVLDKIFQRMRNHHVSYQGISDIMELIFPRGKDTIANAFYESVERAKIPPLKDIQIIHYDEQHPKRGRTQKYRLTLLDGITGRPIAEELYDKKDPETIKAFLEKYLDPDKPTFVVVDMYPSYPEVFKDFFGENLILQICLLHLNKRIVQDFPRKTTIEQELTKYRLLGIFYNRDQEISYLEPLAEKERQMKGRKDYNDWLGEKRKEFKRFVYELKLARRKKKENLPKRSYQEAKMYFDNLIKEIDSFDKPVQKRLRKIKKNWGYFTAFYFVEDAPATNNLLENYYSTSLKTHRKKQLRTDRGIKNQMKLSAMKRAGLLDRFERTLIDAFLMFIPFLKAG